MTAQMDPLLPEPGAPQLLLGVTGHRAANAAYQANRGAVEAALDALFGQIERVAADRGISRGGVRLHSLLVDGVDQLAAELALRRDWQVIAPLPFGADLNRAINARPVEAEDAQRLASGLTASDPAVDARAETIRAVTERAHLFELADRDEEVRELFVDALRHPADQERQRAFHSACSDSVALAGRLMIERVDLMIAVWDRKSSNLPGGTGHTVVRALQLGTPVLLVDPAMPTAWTVLRRQEELGRPLVPDAGEVQAAIGAAIAPVPDHLHAIRSEPWHQARSRVFGLYRLIETVFGGRGEAPAAPAQRYETPGEIGTGSAAPLVATARLLLHDDPDMARRLEATLLPNFALADGVSTWLSDAYRSGMCYNFLFSMLAVIVGIAYLPLGLTSQKWAFASVELLLLLLIVAITVTGGRLGWHRRWFETRRVAEYLRHAPGMLLLGLSRHSGRWPLGNRREWPEQFVHRCLRDIGLPRAKIDRDYLSILLGDVVAPHVVSQRDYHRAKAVRLGHVHHRLDRLAQACFVMAIASVSAYLLLVGAAAAGVVAADLPERTAKVFTFLGGALPTLGAGISGIRYFGDFERFAAISDATAAKLDDIATRIALLLAADRRTLNYSAAAGLVRAVDRVVVEEIAGWQAVFGPKHLTLPA